MSSQPSDKKSTPPWLRGLTWVAAIITIVCFIALIVVLTGYFMDVTVWPGFYGAGLFGLPAGFMLMMLVLILGSIQRRRTLS